MTRFPGLPNLEFAAQRGWRWQLNWMDEEDRPCFIRGTLEEEDQLWAEADRLRAQGLKVELITIPEKLR